MLTCKDWACCADVLGACSGYLHDHRIQGRALLPGAAMFEACAAAARCMSAASASSLVVGVSISAPLALSAAPGGAQHLLLCSASLGSGRLEVRSLAAASHASAPTAIVQVPRLHLAGWTGHALTHASQKERSLSPRSLPGAPALAACVSLASPGSSVQPPTAVAGLVPAPCNSCDQPGGYAVHPAALDAATHTAGAFASTDQAEHAGVPSWSFLLVSLTAPPCM